MFCAFAGLHGKFRPYNGSLQDARRPPPPSSGSGEAVRFPITNGSLFASLDGRVPVLHNYRRGSYLQHTHSLSLFHTHIQHHSKQMADRHRN